MRKLIAGMKISVDGKSEAPEGGGPDWVHSWSDNYGVMQEADACLLGAGMFPGYEQYWGAILKAPGKPLPMTGRLPMPEEVEYARFAARVPHYVLSSTLSSAQWPNATFVRGLDEITALKRQRGKAIYLVGGSRTTSSLIAAGLVDELRLILYPLIAGEGKSLFASPNGRHGLELRNVQQLDGGRVSLIYEMA